MSKDAKILETLKNCSLFKDLSAEDLEALVPLFAEKEMAEGTTVFVENMPGESLYVVRQGTIQISKMIAEGQERTLIVMGPDEVFGEMAIIDGSARSATARVAEKAVLLSIRKSEFEALCERNPRTGLKLMRNIIRLFSQRVRENNDEFRDILKWSVGAKN